MANTDRGFGRHKRRSARLYAGWDRLAASATNLAAGARGLMSQRSTFERIPSARRRRPAVESPVERSDSLRHRSPSSRSRGFRRRGDGRPSQTADRQNEARSVRRLRGTWPQAARPVRDATRGGRDSGGRGRSGRYGRPRGRTVRGDDASPDRYGRDGTRRNKKRRLRTCFAIFWDWRCASWSRAIGLLCQAAICGHSADIKS
jgi:hypothetical protein